MVAHGKGYQTERVVINVTPEQAAAVERWTDLAIENRRQFRKEYPDMDSPPLSKNDVLLEALRHFCDLYRVDWPEHVKVQGQRTDLKPTPKD